MKFQIEVLKSKIHRVSVTQADLNYVGSITIDNPAPQRQDFFIRGTNRQKCP